VAFIKALLAVVLLSGCAGHEDSIVPGWKLSREPEVFVVDYPAAWCPNYPHAIACSHRNPIDMTCTIFIKKNAPDWALRHEKETHCQGRDHPPVNMHLPFSYLPGR
jgi:hypothetical protein